MINYKIMDTLKKYFNQILLIVIMILIALLGMKQCKIDKLQQNNGIYKDSVMVLKNKNGELYSQNDALVLTKKQLLEQNKELANEAKKLKENPIIITKVVTKVVYKDTLLNSDLLSYFDKDGTKIFLVKWQKDTSFTQFDGFKIAGNTYLKIDSNLNSTFYKSSLDSFNLSTKLYLSLTDSEDDNLLHINARSDFPGLSFSNLDGALIDPKKSKTLKKFFPPKRYGLSIFIGYGLSTKNIVFSPIIGCGLTYSIVQW